MSRPGQAYEPPIYAWNIGSIFQEAAARVDMPYYAIETDLVEGYVEGFAITNANELATFFQELCDFAMIDMANYDGALHFIPRGGNVAVHLTTDDLIDDGGEIESVRRRDSISVPRTMTIEYYDSEGGLTQDKQISQRALDSRAVSEAKIDTAIIMRADDAARSVVIRHKVAVEDARGEIEIRLPDSFIALTTSDVVTLNGQRMRIDEVEIDEGFQTLRLAYDRKNAYESAIQGVPISIPATPPSLIADQSRIEIIDSHITRSEDDYLGMYIAVSSVGMDWQGAVVEMSRDGGQTYVSSSSTRDNAVLGVTTAALGVQPVWYPDNNSVLAVKLLRSDMELLPTDLRGMQNRVNVAVVGDEIINFSGVEQVGTDEYLLTGLLRGRKGSPIASHPAGSRFVLMDSIDINYVPAELYDQGVPLTFRVTSIGRVGPDQTQVLTYTGQSQRERAPAYLTAKRSGGQIQINWQGVGRIGGGAAVGMGVYFAGYRVTVNSTTTETQSRALTVTDPGGAVTITVRQLNTITGAGPAVSIVI